MSYVFGVIIPYAAIIIFIAGFLYKIAQWAAAPVPFHIPTACGQQRSLRWILSSRLDNPHSTLGVIGRMALEILFFRSLFRNTGAELKPGPVLVYGSAKWLWLAAMGFHWSLLVVLIRHLRFFTEPQPELITLIQNLDGFFQVALPVLFLSDVILITALAFLFIRRLADAKLRYLSLAADYFPLLLIGSIAVTGMLMRHISKVDLRSVKELTLGLIALQPSIPQGVGILFYIHISLVSVLFACFPFSKLMHMSGIFLSPTRNLANNSRMRRHVNPWNYDVKVHTYEEYEEEFKPVMTAAGLPVEKAGSADEESAS
ncbi:MAG: sulfate reduction electron transfer complex DsrMKJOP subunit DsrM [Acidobacteria bacterium]|nr:sulfate reduction electron transfer complex DsrMKJOP subunit DsrM [Acidobacteriota bacterium]